MKITATLAAAAFGAVAFSGAALAAYTTPPGERAGIDLASPLPEGVYFVNLAGGVGNNRNVPSTGFGSDPASQFNFDVPVIVWSTPWQILGGRLELGAAAPVIEAGTFGHGTHGSYAAGMYNPFLFGSLNFNLGNGFSVGFLQGAYLPITGGEFGNGLNQTTLDEMLALAWHGDNWNLTANLHYNIIGDNQSNFDTFGHHVKSADAFIYDLGVTKTLGKWEIGAVGFGSTDVGAVYNQPINAQFALGGLVGYNFGPVITQVYVTTDVWKQGYTTYETRGWLRVVVPLWNPEAPKVVTAKY
jgi:hypothetical protein